MREEPLKSSPTLHEQMAQRPILRQSWLKLDSQRQYDLQEIDSCPKNVTTSCLSLHSVYFVDGKLNFRENGESNLDTIWHEKVEIIPKFSLFTDIRLEFKEFQFEVQSKKK